MPESSANQSAIVLPVGGGKGGIGKSALTASLGLALARLEHSVAMIDADLGGSDLHNLLGLDNQRSGLGEWLTSKTLDYREIEYPVLEPSLYFVPGDAMVVGTANPGFQKKRKLLTAIAKSPREFVLMDLGAGTAITVMDFFLSSPLSLVVMLPERPAVLSAFNFLKNVLFRSLDRLLRDNAKTSAVLAEFQSRGSGPGNMKVGDLLTAIDQAVDGQGERARAELARQRPKLIVNRVHKLDDFVHASNLQRRVWEDLGLKLEVLGFLPEDEVVRQAAGEGRVALDLDPRAPFCQAVTLLAMKLAPWAGRRDEWQAHGAYGESFERAATEFSPLFPPPGEGIPTRAELLARLHELESEHSL